MSFIDKLLDAVKLNDGIDDEDDEYFDDAEDLDEDEEDEEEEVSSRRRRRASRSDEEDEELDDVPARERNLRKARASSERQPRSHIADEEPMEDVEAEREDRASARAAERARKREKEREQARRERERREREREREEKEREAREREEARSRRSKVTPIRGKKGNVPVSMSVNVVHLTKFDDSVAIADEILSGDTVIINLEGLDNEAAQRAIDFVSGVCYAVDGNLNGISGSILIAAPAGVDISGTYDRIMNGSSGSPDLQAQYM